MVKQFLLGMLLGLVAMIFFAPFDTAVCNRIEQFFAQAMKGSLDATVSCKLKKVNFFLPRFEFEDLCVTDNSGAWSWKSERYVLDASWLKFLLFGTFELGVTLTNLTAHTTATGGSLAIMPHLVELSQVASLPIRTTFKSLVISKGFCSLSGDMRGSLSWSGELKQINNLFRSVIYVRNSSISNGDLLQLQDIDGTITMLQTNDGSLRVKTDCRSSIPQLGNEGVCFISGSWQDDHGRFSLRNSAKTITIDPVVIAKRNDRWFMQTTASIPGSYLAHLLPGGIRGDDGSCYLRISGTLDDPATIDGYASLEDINTVFGFPVSGKVAFGRRDANWSGTVDIRLPGYNTLSGDWCWNDARCAGQMHLTNRALMSFPALPAWKIDPEQISFAITADNTKKIEATYSCALTNKFAHETATAAGKLNLVDDRLTVEGTLAGHHYSCAADLHLFPYISHARYENSNHDPLFEVVRTEDRLNTTIEIALLRSWFGFFGYDLQGEGAFKIGSTIKNNGVLESELSLHEGTIRIPQTYNFLTDFHAFLTTKLFDRELIIKDMQGTLHNGTVTTSHATFSFGNQGAWTAYMPMTFNQCMLNSKQDLFALVSGYLLFEKRPRELPLIKGSIILDRAQLKENIFSQEVQKKLLRSTGSMVSQRGQSLQCDIRVQTKDPIQVDTQLIQASAKVNVAVTGPLFLPTIQGSINLLSGAIHFPYKSLSITKGAITFDPNQPYDPLIELVAKTKVKKHQVALHVSGSVQNHYLNLESSPPLSEEQVISLLLVGSPEQSLNMMMPALIAQNLRSVLFGNSHAGGWDQYYKQWMRPLNIHLIPSFTDQTGRGGLRGALEIDINDRWRAMIQKNFNLTEDTRFELEYFVSDDVSLRAIRNERKDIAAEVELRWKF